MSFHPQRASRTIPPAGFASRRRLQAAAQGKLTSLDLSWNTGLSGTLPSTLYQLGPLTSLNLTHSSVSGSVPSTLGLLSSTLVSVDLSFTGIGGSIPAAALGVNLTSRVVKGLAGAGLCSQALIASSAAISVQAAAFSNSSLLLSWMPPLGSTPAMLACIAGYGLAIANCPGSGTITDAACDWDSSPAAAAGSLPYSVYPGLAGGYLPLSSVTVLGASLQFIATNLTIDNW